MAELPSVEDILAEAAEALESPAKQIRDAEKAMTYKSAREIAESIGLANQLKNGPQYRVVARPRKPKL